MEELNSSDLMLMLKAFEQKGLFLVFLAQMLAIINN
jgi:hypothetical protein